MKINRIKRVDISITKFIACIFPSHNLRNPVTGILLWSEIIENADVDTTKLHKGLQTIRERTLVLHQLINDLLDISRISIGKLSIEMQTIDVVAILQKTIETIRPSADAKSIVVQESIPVVNVFVSADPDRLKQIFWNLLSNALKFTPSGGKIVIILALCGNKVAIKFQDTGQGIKPEFLPHIFDCFSQADTSTTRIHGGLGLGLALIHNLLKMQDGTLEAASPGENKGSTFIITLPLITL